MRRVGDSCDAQRESWRYSDRLWGGGGELLKGLKIERGMNPGKRVESEGNLCKALGVRRDKG